MKKLFYIIIFIAGFQFTSSAQSDFNPTAINVVKVVKFYPNPATSVIHFEIDADYYKSATLIIYNFIGKKQLEQKVTDRKVSVALADFYRGMYIFQLYDKQGKIIESGKFTVSK